MARGGYWGHLQISEEDGSPSASPGLLKFPNDSLTLNTDGSVSVSFGSGSNTNLLQSTGVLTGGVLSIGTGGAGVATTFTIAAGTGQVVNNTVNPTTVTPVSWSQFTDVAITNLATQSITYVAINPNGGSPVVVQSATDWTPSQMRQYIEIGVVSHSDFLTVAAVNQSQNVAYNAGNQLSDLAYALNKFNVSGNVFSANGANLTINKSAGFSFSHGSNYTSLTDNPNIVTQASLSPASFRMVNRSGAAGALVTSLDADNYDVGGTTTALSPNKYTIHRVFLFTSNLCAIQRGQNQYNSLAEAKAAIQNESFVENPGLANGLLRGFILVKKGTTALNNTSDAAFYESGKFGSAVGIGGQSVSTMQNTYDNSSAPQITTDATHGAVQFKRGSASDEDSVWEVLNGAGTKTASVEGEGCLYITNLTTGYVAKTANYTLVDADSTINCTANSFTLTLPTAVGEAGKQYTIKNTGTGVITIATTSSQTIDGATSITLYQYDSKTVQSNGANWIII